MSTKENMSFPFKNIVTILVFFLCLMPVLAQKKDKKRKKKDKQDQTLVKRETRKQISPEDQQKISFHLIEGSKHNILGEKHKALAQFQKVLEIDPSNATASFKVGEILLTSGKIAEAIMMARKAVLKDPKNKYYYLLEAQAHSSNSDFESATEAYRRLIDNVPNTNEYLFDLGGLYLYQNKLEEALKAYQKAEGEFGKKEEILFQKQQIYLKTNRLDELIDDYKSYIAEFPQTLNYRVSLSEILLSNGRHEQAIHIIEEAIKVFPEKSRLSVLLSEAYRKSNRIEDAVNILQNAFRDLELNFNAKVQVMGGYLAMLPNESLEQPLLDLVDILIQTHPDESNAYVIAGDLNIHLERKRGALENYKKALGLSQDNFNIWRNVLQLAMEMEEYRTVQEYGERSLEYFPNQAMLYYLTGISYYADKKYEDAVRVLESGATFAKTDNQMYSYFHGQLGDAYNSLSNHQKSDASYDIALKANPENDHVLNNYSYFLSLRKEKLELAVKLSSRLVDRNPENGTFLDTHGWVLYVMGNYVEAEKYIRKAIEDTENGTILEHYGDILYQLGRVNDAVEYWKKAKNKDDEVSEFIDKKIEDAKLYE